MVQNQVPCWRGDEMMDGWQIKSRVEETGTGGGEACARTGKSEKSYLTPFQSMSVLALTTNPNPTQNRQNHRPSTTNININPIHQGDQQPHRIIYSTTTATHLRDGYSHHRQTVPSISSKTTLLSTLRLEYDNCWQIHSSFLEDAFA